MIEMKGSPLSCMRVYTCSNGKYIRTGSLDISVATWKQPPRGKCAFLCGVSYKNQRYKVRGATQDLKNMKSLPSNSIFPTDFILILAGHGLRQCDLHGDEIDGYDETIYPVDFKTKGMILDNYINHKIVKPLISGVTLHAIVDFCHSGTVLDLPHAYDINAKIERGLRK